MNSPQSQGLNYKKIEIDNSVCRRRFHIAYEEGQSPVAETKVLCPHCGVTLFEARNHPPAILSRDENLVKSPDGTNTTLSECQFLK
ncbi:MAG: hypothetical protein RL189_2937 [Pseudomonadota bacterium]|jgi:hypothetical protein